MNETFEVSLAVARRFIDENEPLLDIVANVTLQALYAGGTLLFLGNGGSAMQAQHLAAEFVGRYHDERRPLPAIALTADSAVLTAVANDYGYKQLFVRQLQALVRRPADLVFLISTSGASANVLEAADWCRAQHVRTVALTGAQGPLRTLADHALCVPSTHAGHVQAVHLIIGHALCEMVDRAHMR